MNVPDRIRSLKRTPLGRFLVEGRDFWQADAFVLSFPKCGRTWLRVLLGRVFQLHFGLEHPHIERRLFRLHKLYRMNPAVPRVILFHDDHPHWKKPEEMKRTKRMYARSRVILLVRDPRDVVVSFYYEQSKRFGKEEAETMRRRVELRNYRDRIDTFRGDISEFIRAPYGSFDTILEYYNIWNEYRHRAPRFLLLRYEDLKADTTGSLRRTMGFLDIPEVTDETLNNAVNYGSFENMRKMEVENRVHDGALAPKIQGDEQSFKTRKGKVGGWREQLCAEDIAWLNGRMRERLKADFGYAPE